MPRYAFERLTAQDAGFLWAERPNEPMHVGAVALFEAGPLKREDGSIDRLKTTLEGEAVYDPDATQELLMEVPAVW